MADYTILSIDIGVKNLAYCLMSAKDEYTEGDNYIITDWKSINLLDDEDLDICEGIIKSGKNKGLKCGKQSKITTENDECFCNVHNPDKTKYRPKKPKKVRSVPLKDKCLRLYHTLEKYPVLLSIPREVVIEQQMKRNPTMLQMSHLVYSYFIMKGYVDPNSPIQNVRFVSSRNKLKVYTGPPIECHLKNAYSRRKWFACEYTKWIIRNNPKALDYLSRFPRKVDDLSDCFLQGVWYLNRNGAVAKKRIKIKKNPRKNIKKSKSKGL